jgi:hypothetical protein
MLTTWSHSELAREKMWSRIHLIPVLQAEEDRDLVRRHLADKARERELLGGETKVYNNDRYGMLSAGSGGIGKLTCAVDSCGLHTRSHRATQRSRGSTVSQHSCHICIYHGVKGVAVWRCRARRTDQELEHSSDLFHFVKT